MTETAALRPPRVIAVIPTYRADDAVLEGLGAVTGQVHSVIVVDDGTPSDPLGILDRLELAGAHVMRHRVNRGIAAALNSGITLALSLGADYVLTIDQDTVLPHHYVSDCLTAFRIASPATNLGIVCTDRVNGHPSVHEQHTLEGLGLVREAIQSGFLISAECLTACGLFDERLFIDCVDTEYCLRITQLGFRIAVGPGTDIIHSLGEQVPLRPFGIPRHDPLTGTAETYEYHGPIRRYYIARNNVDLYLRYLGPRPLWVASAMKQELWPTLTTILSGPERLRQLGATLVGAFHGIIRRRGPISPALRRALTP